MSGAPRFVLPYQTVIDAAGVPIPGALLNFYYSGTSTRADTYSNSTLTVANTNPVVALDNGQFPNIFMNPAVTYKVVLTDSLGNEIWTADPVNFQGPFYPIAFEFLGGAPEANEIMGMHIFTTTVVVPANMVGSAGYTISDPASDLVVTASRKNGTVVGTMTIDAGGVFTFATTGGTSKTFPASDALIFQGPAIAVAGLANATWTIAGVLG